MSSRAAITQVPTRTTESRPDPLPSPTSTTGSRALLSPDPQTFTLPLCPPPAGWSPVPPSPAGRLWHSLVQPVRRLVCYRLQISMLGRARTPPAALTSTPPGEPVLYLKSSAALISTIPEPGLLLFSQDYNFQGSAGAARLLTSYYGIGPGFVVGRRKYLTAAYSYTPEPGRSGSRARRLGRPATG